MNNFSINQRVWLNNDYRGGEVRRIDSTAFGQEIVVKLDHSPSWDSGNAFVESALSSQKVPSCPLFGVFSVDGRNLFVTPEALSPDALEAEPSRWDQGAVWARIYSRDNPGGVSGEVPISRIMELTEREFAQAKESGWNHVPFATPGRVSDLSL